MNLGRYADGVDIVLEEWAKWVRACRGWSAGESAYSHRTSQTFEEMLREDAVVTARLVNDAVNDLSESRPAHASAIHHIHLDAVYRFGGLYSDPRQRETRVLAVYQEAKESLSPLLRRRGVHIPVLQAA